MVDDCVPEGSPLVVPVDRLGERARWAVEHWEEAVAANRRLVNYVREIRSPERTGRKTLADMAHRESETADRYAEIFDGTASERPAIGRAIERIDANVLALDELDESGARVTDDGEPLLSHDWCTLTDLVFCLKAEGYRDTGNAGTPVFRRAPGGSERTTGS